jgi:PAS domain S-box-containing protein
MNFPDTIIGFAVLDFEGRLISYSETSIPPLIDDLKQELNIFDDEFSKPIFVQLRKTNTCAKIYHESTRILIIFQDLSQWVKIQEINEELEAIIHHSHDGIYVTDGTGTTLRVSAGSERNFGIEARKLVGRNVQDIEKEGIFQPSVARLVLDKRERVTVYQKTAVGTVMLATGNPIFNEQNEIVRVICNSRDVTELTQLKEQIKKKEEMVKRYESELYELRSKETSIDGFIIHSKKMTDIVSLLQRIAPVNSTVLITGESGTGKEVIAKSIHTISSRNQGPLDRKSVV